MMMMKMSISDPIGESRDFGYGYMVLGGFGMKSGVIGVILSQRP